MDNQKALTDLFSKLDKKYGKGSLNMGETIVETPRLSTGSLGLDIITGGGWGKGRIVEIYAPESAGKTTVCIHTMVSAQKNEPDKRVGFIDAEHAFDRKYAENLGLDMSQILISQPDSGEQGLEILEALIDSNLMSVVVVDSVAALVPQSELDGDMGDSKMGVHAKLMSQALRKLAGKINKSGTVVIFTNQLRDKIGVMFGNPETTTGGNALKFYASTRLDLRRKKGAADKESNMVLHNRVTAKTIKNKIAPPYQETQFDIVFGEGINHHSEVLFYAEALEIIKKSGSWYTYGDVKLGQGESNVINFLSDNPELSAEIESKIRQQYGI